MKGKKVFFADVLNYLGLLKWAAGRFPRNLIIYNYHRLKPDGVDHSTCFDEDVFGPKATTFKMQVKWLKTNTQILSENELLEIVEKKDFPRQICSMITFDDGYIDNYTLAYPILKTENIPAIFFIPSNTITTGQLGWWDIISYLLKNTDKETIFFEGEEIPVKNHYSLAKHFFLQKFKLEPYEKTEQLLGKLSEICEVLIPDINLQKLELMNWEQIKEISQNNIAIGSHTHNHHVLATLESETQYKEAMISKDLIQCRIGQEVNSISYPVGGYSHFSAESKKIVKLCGYRLAFSFNTGVNKWNSIDLHDMKRIAPSEKNSLFRATTLLPEIFV